MGLVWYRSRAELRAKWRSVLMLSLVVAIGGGAALAAFAGARRTEAAMPGFVAYSLPDDGGFLFGSYSSPPPASVLRPTRWPSPRPSSESLISHRSSPTSERRTYS